MRKDSLANQKPEDKWKWLSEFLPWKKFPSFPQKNLLRVDEGPNCAEKKLKNTAVRVKKAREATVTH